MNREEKKSLGDCSGGGTPGPISNPEVKPASADGTRGEALWESRSLPRDFFFCAVVQSLCEPSLAKSGVGAGNLAKVDGRPGSRGIERGRDLRRVVEGEA